MLPWIIQISVISLILIVLVHYLFTFFKTALTVPKVKDLVDRPKHQYEVLFNTVHIDNNANKKDEITPHTNKEISNDNLIPNMKTSQEERSTMKSELKNYLKELNNPASSSFPSSFKKSTLENTPPPSSYNMDITSEPGNSINQSQSQGQSQGQSQSQNNSLNDLDTHSFGNSMYSSY